MQQKYQRLGLGQNCIFVKITMLLLVNLKDPYEDKYQYLINKTERVGIYHVNGPKAFIEYSNDMRKVYKNIDN